MPSKNLNLPLLGETLTRHYRLSCELYDTYPKGRFTYQLSHATLSLDLTELDGSHLEALCHTICNKLSPVSIQVSISPAKEVGAKVLERMVEGISICLTLSLTLTTFNLHGIKLKGKAVELLCQGLTKCHELKTLSLVNCWLGDSGTEQVCQAIKNVPSITQLALVDCRVSARGAAAVACLIKHQKLNRDSAMWQDTLRHREPHLDGMRGLRRVTLNNNPQLGDAGVVTLVEALTEDLWIKALDVQNCGVGSEGGEALRKLVDTNQTLEVVDLRRNPFVPENLPQELITILNYRHNQYSQQYAWLEMTEGIQGGGAKESPGSYLDTGRTRTPMASKGQRPSFTTIKKRPKAPSQLGIPWRVEHRLYERREGMAPGSMVDIVFSEHQENFTVTTTATSPAPQLTTKDATIHANMKKQLEQYKKRYQRERKRRKQAEGKLSHLKTQLQGKHLLDEQAVVQIEECFEVFQSFLAHVQNYGLQWQPSEMLSNAPGNIKASGRQQEYNTHQPNSQPVPSSLSVNTIPIPSVSTLPTCEVVDYIQNGRFQPPVSFTVPIAIHSKKTHEGKSFKRSRPVLPIPPAGVIATQSNQKVLENVSSSVNVAEYQVETSQERMSRNGEGKVRSRRKKVTNETKDAESHSNGTELEKDQETKNKAKGIGGDVDVIRVQDVISDCKYVAESNMESNIPRLPLDLAACAKSYEVEKEEGESSDIPSLASSEIRNAISEGEIEFTGSEFDIHEDDEIGVENYRLLNQGTGTVSAKTGRGKDKNSNIEPAVSEVESSPEISKGTHIGLQISSPEVKADHKCTTQISDATHSLQVSPPRRVHVESTQATIGRTVINKPKLIQESSSRSSSLQVNGINTNKEHLEIFKESMGGSSSSISNVQAIETITHKLLQDISQERNNTSNNLQTHDVKVSKQHHEIGQSNETSETDDEKLKNIHSSLLHLTARAGSMSSSSSLSITEQLSQSHSRWSKSAKKSGKHKSPNSLTNVLHLAESHQHKQVSLDSLQNLQRSPDILQNIQILPNSHQDLMKIAEPPQSEQLSPNFQQNIKRFPDSQQLRDETMESHQSVLLNKPGVYTSKENTGLKAVTSLLPETSTDPKLRSKGSYNTTQTLTEKHGFLQSSPAYKSDKHIHSQASNSKHSNKQGIPIYHQNVQEEEDQENTNKDTAQVGDEEIVEASSDADREDGEYRSDFEQSEGDDESISVTSLTTTSIPDDLLTPGEEDF